MDARSPHPPVQDASSAGKRPAEDAGLFHTPAGLADRACCCPAYAAVRVVMPATAARPHETELLLCGHHYRISREALAAARAAVHVLRGTEPSTAAWIGLS